MDERVKAYVMGRWEWFWEQTVNELVVKATV